MRVTQLFSYHGSQISANLLGKKKDFYVKTLRGLWSVHNNMGHSKFRNVVERRVGLLKRMIKQGLFGMPGPQTETVDRSLPETAMSGAVYMIENTPYTSAGINTLLLAPADTLTPWKGINPSVQELPDSRLKTLAEARRIIVVKHEKMR